MGESICGCGKGIERRGKFGPWPTRCGDCALMAGRAKSIAWFYKSTAAQYGELRSRYPNKLGRPQSAEHIRKRNASARAKLAETRRVCADCGTEYTPTMAAQRYCPNHKRILTPGTRIRPQHKTIYLPGGAYEQILAEQSGVCAICAKPPNGSRLCVDHNHETGQVRGLLCYQCNTGLGSFRDDKGLLKSALAYLRGTSQRGQLRLVGKGA